MRPAIASPARHNRAPAKSVRPPDHRPLPHSPVTWQVVPPYRQGQVKQLSAVIWKWSLLGSKHGGQLTVSVHAASTPHHIVGLRLCTVVV